MITLNLLSALPFADSERARSQGPADGGIGDTDNLGGASEDAPTPPQGVPPTSGWSIVERLSRSPGGKRPGSVMRHDASGRGKRRLFRRMGGTDGLEIRTREWLHETSKLSAEDRKASIEAFVEASPEEVADSRDCSAESVAVANRAVEYIQERMMAECSDLGDISMATPQQLSALILAGLLDAADELDVPRFIELLYNDPLFRFFAYYDLDGEDRMPSPDTEGLIPMEHPNEVSQDLRYLFVGGFPDPDDKQATPEPKIFRAVPLSRIFDDVLGFLENRFGAEHQLYEHYAFMRGFVEADALVRPQLYPDWQAGHQRVTATDLANFFKEIT